MQLISGGFFLFIIFCIALYYICPRGARWVILLASSLVFYAFSGIEALIFMITVSLSSYACALVLQRCKKEGSDAFGRTVFFSAIIFIVGAWMFSRLRGHSVLGISFYSLRVISYLAEVKRGKLRAEANPFKYILFVSFFPIALLGPVARYGEMSDSLFSGEGACADGFFEGILRFLWGIFKKCVIANSLALPLARIYENPREFGGAYVIFLLIFYSAEIYTDFSGGIDMAMGISLMLGIKLPENFKKPFSARDLRKFWNLWHITLGEWFERYIFYPLSLSKPMQRLSGACRRRLGAKRGKKIPVYISTLFTWLMTGLWHGSRGHFIAWGLINGALVLLSQELVPHTESFYGRHPKLRKDGFWLTAFGRIRVFFVIGAVRLLDVYESLPLTFGMLGGAFGSFSDFFSGGLFELIEPLRLTVIILSLILVFLVSEFGSRVGDMLKRPLSRVVCIFSLALLSIVFGVYGIGFEAGEFIYSRF